MFNATPPSETELPSTKQLLKSTVIALVTALIILVTVVLPAEYAIDPTGAGRMLGLTDMGEIKQQLEQEAARDAEHANASATQANATPIQPLSDEELATIQWQDRVLVTLKPSQGAEVKLAMDADQSVNFAWTAKGGAVNFDAHGDGNGQFVSYQKGRSTEQASGKLVAAFSGNHGWFFRNRTQETVMVILRVQGDYSDVKKYNL